METENKKPKKVNWWIVYWVFFGILLIFACVNARADEVETTADESSSSDLEDNPVYQFLDTRSHTFSDIIADEDTYNALKSTVKSVNGVDLPDFVNVNDFAKRMYAYVLGNYVDVSQETWQVLVNAFSDPAGTLADLGEYIFYDLGLGEWVFDDDIEDYVKSGVDHHIRVRTDSKIGEWVALPVTYQNANDSGGYQYQSDYAVYTTFITNGSGGQTGSHYFAIRSNSTATAQERPLFANGSYGSWSNFNIATAYTGTEYSGYYANRGSGRLLPASQGYATMSDALADFFGDAEETGGYEIQGAHIINDNFTVNPLSVFPSVGYPFEDDIVNNYVNDNDVAWDNDIINYYPQSYNYELPYWFVTPTKSYPAEPDFLDNVAVDVPNMPQGSFIQVVYEDFPAGIVLMITASLSIGILFRVIS